MELNIKIGDYVIVKSVEECRKVSSPKAVMFASEMEQWCGKRMKVVDFNYRHGWLSLENCEWIWSESMVELITG